MKNLLQKAFENEFNEAHYKELIQNLFNRFDFSKEHTLKHYFTEDEKGKIEDLTFLGSYEDLQNKSLDILIAELKGGSKVERARSLQRNLIGKYLKSNLKDSALVAFYSQDNPDWRLSFVKMDYRLDEKGVKTEIGTPPKRYSFLVGRTEPSHTAQKQLLPLLDYNLLDDKKTPTVDEIEKAFSVEKVTKDFYIEIAKKFTELVGGERKTGTKKMVEKGLLSLPSTNDDTIKKEFGVRLIGRLLFCWFLKKKKSEKGLSLITDEIISSAAVQQKSNYYHNLLEPLFFQVLNTLQENRKEYFRNDLWNMIPFLNGGLFEPHHHDFYVPAEPFGHSRHINTLKIPDTWFIELFKIFEIYNFTIDESTTIDVDISVDPEMLGRIFENLLAEINPETGETARKSTGSYYTPRPIVEYMVDESMKQYLLTQIHSDSNVIARSNSDEAKLSRLLSYADWDVELTESEKDLVIDALDRVKIIDPACGSGAFPMGILHKMLLILQKIDPESKNWLSRKLARIDNEILRKELEKKLKTENWDYVHKLGIIQNSIYGIDIQPIAVEISKLRFFLSLIVDEKIDDNKPNRGIVPLPNLEFKFVAANSLIGLPKTESQTAMFEATKEIERLKRLREEYFTGYGEGKRRIEKEFIETQTRMFEHAINWRATDSQTMKLSQWNPFSDDASSWFDPYWMFGIPVSSPFEKGGEGGFDIVIANPPYVRQEDIKHLKPALQKQGFEVYNSTSDLYTYFYEKAYQVLDKRGVFCFISSNKFMRAKYGEKLRRLLQANTALKQIINFGGHKVFESATVDTCIVVFVKERKENNKVCFLNIIDDFTPQTDIQLYFAQKGLCIPQSKLSQQHWTLADDSVLRLKEKIEKTGTALKDWDVRIYRGIITGFNEAFIIDNETKGRLCKEDPKSTEILKPILRGRDIERYSYKWAGLWLIKIESGWTNKNRGKKDPERFFKETYPAVYEHLKLMGDKKGKGKGLYNRDDQGDYWWELRDCAYYEEFKKEKIVYPDISERLSFAFENGVKFVNNTAYFLNAGNKYLLAVLNSLLADFYYRQISSQLGNEAIRAFTIFIEQLPIPKISENAQQPFITLVDQILAAKKKGPDADISALEHQIDQLVYDLYGLTPEEIEIVEENKQASNFRKVNEKPR